jgi:hypothetical protein
MKNIFGVESDVAQKVAQALEARLTGREKKQMAFEGTKNPDAYDAVLHGIALRNSQSSADVLKMLVFRTCGRAGSQLRASVGAPWRRLFTALSIGRGK